MSSQGKRIKRWKSWQLAGYPPGKKQRLQFGRSKTRRQIQASSRKASDWGAKYSYREKPVYLKNITGFMPNRLGVPLRFASEFNITTAGGAEDTVFRGNSPYDPFVAAGGAEAAGWDELQAMYNYYRVTACGIKITIVNLDTDDPIRVSLWASDDVATFNGYEQSAQRGCKTITVTPEHGSGTLTHWARSKDILGPYVADADTWSVTSAAPGVGWYWHFGIRNISTNALNCNYHVEIVYSTEFFNLKTQRLV